jgi:hypothetical protein
MGGFWKAPVIVFWRPKIKNALRKRPQPSRHGHAWLIIAPPSLLIARKSTPLRKYTHDQANAPKEEAAMKAQQLVAASTARRNCKASQCSKEF